MLICLSAIFETTSVSAQKLTAKNIACNESPQARYECYIKVQKDSQALAATRKSNLDLKKQIRQEDYFKRQELQGTMENAKELGEIRKSILEEKEKLRLELSENIGKQLEKEHQDIMQQVEYSRSRNISHKGEKYSITYGYVPELRP